MMMRTWIPTNPPFNQFFIWAAMVVLGAVLFASTFYGYHEEKLFLYNRVGERSQIFR
jgi:hypothetical protein